MDIKLLNCKEIENLTEHERILYFSALKEYCAGIRLRKEKKIYGICRNIITTIAPQIRNYNFELRGTENLPKNCFSVIIPMPMIF